MRRIPTPVCRCVLTAAVLLSGEAAADSIGINFNSNRDAAVAEIGPSESVGWVSQTVPMVVEAIGESVVIEFNFISDSSPDAFSGLSIDNVRMASP